MMLTPPPVTPQQPKNIHINPHFKGTVVTPVQGMCSDLLLGPCSCCASRGSDSGFMGVATVQTSLMLRFVRSHYCFGSFSIHLDKFYLSGQVHFKLLVSLFCG
jgi:hypothetical protein